MLVIDKTVNIPCIKNGGKGKSFFSTRHVKLQGDDARMLSEQQACVNFRLRTSDSSYASDWHVAGDPTLLVILTGTVRIILRDNAYKDFSAGQMFVAEDFLSENIVFESSLHGHRAEVVGGGDLSVLHLKLEKRD